MLYVHGVTYSDEVGSNNHMPQCNTICFAHHRLYDKITYDIHSSYIIIKQFLAFMHINSSKIFGFMWALFSYQNWIWYIPFGIIDTSWSRYDTKKVSFPFIGSFLKKNQNWEDLMFSLLPALTSCWPNSHVGDLLRHDAHVTSSIIESIRNNL